ncbi:tetratricopeptide repeat protein [uncultured Thiodictyon sp.]|uniref:tetratricopeptide repeat protein n=1 Tax=uncultured Thiodictyon sp. TaxID=1846217 RepID=UPI0025E93506|nr:tetratricopeptide repeat protein [uncultured Thiodictyon sp.]
MSDSERGLGAAALALGLAAGLAVASAGCVGLPSKVATGLGAFSELYDGKSEVAFATQLPVTSAPEAIARGDLAGAGGDLDRALFEYIRALSVDEGNAEALYKIGLIHAGRGNQRLAEMAFRWSLQKAPRNAGALTELGILLLKNRQYAPAKQNLTQAVGLDDRISRAHNALGVIADLDHDYSNAQYHYQKALDSGPRTPSVFNNLGYSRYLSGQWDGAIAAYRQALLSDPNYVLAWRNLSLVYTRQGRYTEAVEALSKVQDLPKSYNDVGYVAMVEGKLDDAQRLFAEAKRLSPDFYTLADTNQRRVEIMQGHAAAP